MTLTITLSHPSNKPNGRVPLTRAAAMRANYARLGEKTHERRDGYMAALVALRKLPPVDGKVPVFVPTGYRLVWYYKGMRPDADNIVARCKHVLDGCAVAFGVNDATWEFGGVQRVHDKARGGQVEIVFDDVRWTMDDGRCGNSAPSAQGGKEGES